MQVKEKLMHQTWENVKNPNFGLFDPDMGSQNFVGGFYLKQMLYIVASYHCACNNV